MLGIDGRRYEASKPQPILDEIRGCRHFLDAAIEYDKAGNREKLGTPSGDFLKSFRTIAYRLCGVAKNPTARFTAKRRPSNCFPN